jgi:hypothetical protein
VSANLDALLDLTRIADCAMHDAHAEHRPFCFIPKEHPMRHCTVSASRAYAEISARKAPEPQGRDFKITITRHNQPDQVVTLQCCNGLEASFQAIELAAGSGVPHIRPVVELTYFEGLDAYPRPLHRDASLEAHAGWDMAETRHLRDARMAAHRACLQVEATLWGAA